MLLGEENLSIDKTRKLNKKARSNFDDSCRYSSATSKIHNNITSYNKLEHYLSVMLILHWIMGVYGQLLHQYFFYLRLCLIIFCYIFIYTNIELIGFIFIYKQSLFTDNKHIYMYSIIRSRRFVLYSCISALYKFNLCLFVQ